MPLEFVRTRVSRSYLAAAAAEQFGDLIKAVVDVRRRIMVVGGELHSDEEAALLEDGSRQEDLWGVNLYPAEDGDEWLEFDSMINVRPSQGNRSRGVEDARLQASIRQIVDDLVAPESSS